MRNKEMKASTRPDIKEVLADLQEKVKEIFSSEFYLKEYLKVYSSFHNYSVNNTILILMQRPESTRVASFLDWKKLGGKVRAGEKGMKILVPTPKKIKQEREILNEDGDVEAVETIEQKRMFFKIGYVFDVSQVDVELPSLTKQLDYNSDFLKDIIRKIVAKSETPIFIEDASEVSFGSSNGYYSLVAKEIHVRGDLSDLHMLKTIVHELSHSIQETKYEAIVKGFTREAKEVVAEACAYTVLRAMATTYGIEELDSSQYSLGYIVGWSIDKETKELKETLDLIAEIVNSLLDWIEGIQKVQQA